MDKKPGLGVLGVIGGLFLFAGIGLLLSPPLPSKVSLYTFSSCKVTAIEIIRRLTGTSSSCATAATGQAVRGIIYVVFGGVAIAWGKSRQRAATGAQTMKALGLSSPKPPAPPVVVEPAPADPPQAAAELVTPAFEPALSNEPMTVAEPEKLDVVTPQGTPPATGWWKALELKERLAVGAFGLSVAEFVINRFK